MGDLPGRPHVAPSSRPSRASCSASSKPASRRRSRRTSGQCWSRITLNDVPIDVLAERLDTTRGALYKTLHDARKKLRSHIAEKGIAV